MAYAGDWPPKKGLEFLLVFPIYDSDGNLIVSATGLDSEKSVNGGAFSDCTNEATHIGQGIYTLTLTAAEMTCDVIVVITKTTSPGARVHPIVIYTANVQTYAIWYQGTLIKAKTDNLPTDPADDSDIKNAIKDQTAMAA